MMGYRVLRLHTSHDELAFKTFEGKALFDQVYACLEEKRHSAEPQASSPQTPTLDQIRKLGELRDAGILTEDEFDAKKKELLTRL